MNSASPSTDDDSLNRADVQSPQRPVSNFSFSLATVFWTTTCIVLLISIWQLVRQNSIARREIARLEQQVYLDSTIRVDYNYITLFRVNRNIFALRMTPVKGGTAEEVDYEWIKLSRTKDVDDQASWKEAFDRQLQDNRGSGSVDEANNDTKLEIGPITMHWSRGGLEFGWLYLSEAEYLDSMRPAEFEVYRSQLVRLDQADRLNERLWKPLPPGQSE